MARTSKKAKRVTLARKKRCFFHCLFHFKLSLRSRLVLGSQVINWSKKIGKLMWKPRRKIRQRSVEWFHWDVPAISSSLHMSRICFSSGALNTFLFYMNLYLPFNLFFHFVNVNVNKTHFPATATRVSRPWRFWDIIENRACAAVVHGFSKPRTTFECIYTNTFTSKVSRGLEKPIPKPLGQDKPRLELALGWISREHRFCTIYTGCSHLM